MRRFMLLCVMFHTALSTGLLLLPDKVPLVPTCRKALNFMVRGKYVAQCVYLCEGLPYRSSWEYDGTPCVQMVGGETTEGFCKDGKCELVETKR